MKDTITNYCKSKGISVQTFYSRLNKAIARGENYSKHVTKPYSQYDALLQPTTYRKSEDVKEIDLDREWEKICRKYTDPDTREIVYLRVLSRIIPIDKNLLQELQDVHQREEARDVHITFRKEIGIVEESKVGRPRKY